MDLFRSPVEIWRPKFEKKFMVGDILKEGKYYTQKKWVGGRHTHATRIARRRWRHAGGIRITGSACFCFFFILFRFLSTLYKRRREIVRVCVKVLAVIRNRAPKMIARSNKNAKNNIIKNGAEWWTAVRTESNPFSMKPVGNGWWKSSLNWTAIFQIKKKRRLF